MIRQLTKEPIKIFSRRFQCAAGYYFTKEPTLVISGDLPDGVEYYSELTDQAYAATNKDVIVYDAENTNCLTTTKRVFSNKLNDVVFNLYYFTTNRAQAFDRFDKHTMTIDYATTAVPTYSKEIKSVKIGLNKNSDGEYVIPDEGYSSKLQVVGSAETTECSNVVCTNNLISNNPSFQVYLLKHDPSLGIAGQSTLYYKWTEKKWYPYIDTATAAQDLKTWLSFNTNTVYPPIGCLGSGGTVFENDELVGVAHSTDYPSQIEFPSLKRTHFTTATVDVSTLIIPEEDLFIEPGMSVSGTGIAANTKVKSIAGKSIVLDTPAASTASSVVTFSKDRNEYRFYIVGTSGTALPSGAPTAGDQLAIYQYKRPTLTIKGYSHTGKFTIPAGLEVELPFNVDFTNRNTKGHRPIVGRKITFTTTIQPSGGMSDVQVAHAVVPKQMVYGFDDVEAPLVASAQQYTSSQFIKLESTKGIVPGMLVSSANTSAEGDYPCNLSGGTTSTTTFTTTNTTLVEVDSAVESVTLGQVLPAGSSVQSRSIISGPLQQIVIDKPIDNSIFDKANMPVELTFTTATSITAFPKNAHVVSVDSETQITVSEQVDLTTNDNLTFTTGKLDASDVSLTAVESGANAIISGTITISKTNKIDSCLYIDLDNILTES